MDATQLREIIERHRKWLRSEAGGERADLEGADFEDANLRGANLRGAYLRGANLRGANLRGADLGGANLRDADLLNADLRGAYLRGVDLRGADLRGADLRGADLQGANLRDANLSGANLQGADLRGADLRGVNLHDVKTDANTKVDGGRLIGMPRHPIWVRTDGTISIGCQCHSLDHWLANYREIGLNAGYHEEEIQLYSDQLKQIAGELTHVVSEVPVRSNSALYWPIRWVKNLWGVIKSMRL